MKLANHLLNFCSFSLEGKCERDIFYRLVLFSISTLAILMFLVIQSLLSLLLSQNYTIAITSFVAFIALTTLLYFVVQAKQLNGMGKAALLVVGMLFLFYLSAGAMTTTGTLFFALFPVYAIICSGQTRGSAYSIVFWGVAALILFLPLDLNLAYRETIGAKILFLTTYLIVLFTFALVDFFKQRIIQQSEIEMLDQKNANKLKEEFIAKLSHQIRTPLNNVMVISNILSNTDLDEKQRDMIDTIQASTNNLVNVLNSMVEISNVEIRDRGEFNINFNLASTISNTLKLFSSQSINTISFNLKVDDTLPKSFTGDPIKIKQIFLNIIENIIKNKSSNKASIDIKVGKSKENDEMVELFFEIRCNRPIMLPVNSSHSQFIVNETTFSSASTQIYIELLDLNITQNLIESNGGKLSINLTSENAAFTFPYVLNKIPVEFVEKTERTEDRETIDQIKSERVTKPRSEIELENASVLLVEDNLINQKIVILSLKKLVKNIEIANNGKEALDKFGTSKYDIILMDIQMPIMNGIVTTKKIREIESSTNSHTPIIAITANALLGDREDCIAAGMDDYISKPFQIEVLIQKMKNLLKARG